MWLEDGVTEQDYMTWATKAMYDSVVNPSAKIQRSTMNSNSAGNVLEARPHGRTIVKHRISDGKGLPIRTTILKFFDNLQLIMNFTENQLNVEILS